MDAYFTRSDEWFVPTDHSRGPWDVDACHAGPPTALMVGAAERVASGLQLVRFTVEFMRPIPMKGFRVQAKIRRPGRQTALTEAEIFDDERIYARGFGMHLRVLEDLEVRTAAAQAPRFEDAVPGPFPLREQLHDLESFISSVECRYDPEGSHGGGGPTTMWMRTRFPLLPDAEPSPFQRICPLADSGNGISFNQRTDEVHFVNTDLAVSLHRPPEGEWFASRSVSHWQPTGIGVADAELYDVAGPVGRATQSLLLSPVR